MKECLTDCGGDMGSKPTGATVTVFGGDPVVGRAIMLLLQDVGYVSSYLSENSLDHLADLDGDHLLLLGAECSTERRESIEAMVESGVLSTTMPILALRTSRDRVQIESEYDVPWPCSSEELRRWIDSALLSENEARKERPRYPLPGPAEESTA